MFFFRPFGDRWIERGDISTLDYTKAALTIDGSWHDLDVSGIVGKGRKLLLIQGYLKDNAGGKAVMMRTKGFSNEINVAECMTEVADKQCDHNYWVRTDVNGIIQYKIDVATWAIINLVIRGYFY